MSQNFLDYLANFYLIFLNIIIFSILFFIFIDIIYFFQLLKKIDNIYENKKKIYHINFETILLLIYILKINLSLEDFKILFIFIVKNKLIKEELIKKLFVKFFNQFLQLKQNKVTKDYHRYFFKVF